MWSQVGIKGKRISEGSDVCQRFYSFQSPPNKRFTPTAKVGLDSRVVWLTVVGLL